MGYTIAEFERTLDREGVNLDRWPAGERAAALELLEASEEARALLRATQAVETIGAARTQIKAPAGLADRIVAKALGKSPPKRKPRR